MKTLTFYSYKGGVGRSLALVNIATRLAEFGKKVCVIDFDLEAPGLHLKFSQQNPAKIIDKGIVDYVYDFSNHGILHKKIKDYSIDINVSKNGKPISLIAAGNTESVDYWKKLSSINWYDLIYENKNGLAFFLHLKEHIQKHIKPDFLLIDSRTGISEMSGITLSLMADEVVIIAANNKENLSGAKKIINSISNPDNNILGKTPNITFVLSRIPFTDKPEDRAKELLLINRIKREYLLPFVNDINIIHSDRELEEVEKIKIAYQKDESNTQISIDYLKLFEKLTKDDLSDNEIRRFNNIRESERLLALATNTDNVFQRREYITSAIELNKNNPDFYLYRANVNFSLEEYNKSLEDLEKALNLNESFIAALNLQTAILIKLKKYEEAEMKANHLLKIRPYDINAFINKIIIRTRLKDYDAAEHISTELIKLAPDFSVAHSLRGNIQRMKKKFDCALEDVYKALELDSENLQAIATLAEIYAETGKINDFYIHLESSLKINSDFMETVIIEEEVYKQFFDNERFMTLLLKYGISINEDIV